MAAKLSGGAGSGKYNVGQNSEINVTPFVDVMLVLLIIFMVAAPLATVSIKLDLPPAVDSPPPLVKPKPPTVINIQKSGAIFVGDRETTIPTLAADVAGSLSVPDPQAESVYIRADREVKYSQFMAVVNQLQTSGYFKVSLITEDRIDG